MSDATCRDNDATNTVEWLDVKAAAIRLNISERTVQRQAKSGDLPAQMDGKRLLVCVPVLSEPTQEAADSDATLRQTTRHDATEAENDASRPLLEQLQGENAWLRAQVETHQQNEAELRRLMLADKQELNALRDRVQKLLAAPPVEPIEEPLPEAAPMPSSATHSASTAEQGVVPVESGQRAAEPRRWWEVWKR